VHAEGAWRRTWRQSLGPFGLMGAGEIRVQASDVTTGLLFSCGDTQARIFLSADDGSRSPDHVLEPSITVDLPLWEAGDTTARFRSLHVASGEICLVGLTVNAAVLSQYARGETSVDHLPL
jgi:hypothetical protein